MKLKCDDTYNTKPIDYVSSTMESLYSEATLKADAVMSGIQMHQDQ
jgi:hypothetical protein